MEYISKSEKETQAIAKSIAATLKGGDILALKGDLGSGKTTFTKALAQALGISESITSPTYVILKQYPVQSGNIRRLVHVDCYRIEGEEDLVSIGLSDLLDDRESVIVIEWPEKIKSLIKNARQISFSHLKNGERKIVV